MMQTLNLMRRGPVKRQRTTSTIGKTTQFEPTTRILVRRIRLDQYINDTGFSPLIGGILDSTRLGVGLMKVDGWEVGPLSSFEGGIMSAV